MQSQKAVNIHGSIYDKDRNQPLEFATIQLLQLPDSNIIKSAVTDRRGRFEMQAFPATYILRYSFISYETTQQTINVTVDINLGKLLILPVSSNLAEVQVTGTRRLLSANIDRKVYNVGQDIFSQSGSASDVLRNIPSVDVDMDGNITLRGSGNLLILINGKPSPLLGKSPGEILQQFPANTIERVEIITNPSARHRPDGTSGIINIVLKKNMKEGLNGSVTASAGSRNRKNVNVNLNYRTGKWNFTSGYSIRKDNRLRNNTNVRTVFDPSQKPLSYYSDTGQLQFKLLSHIFTFGADYQLNEKNSFGISGNTFQRKAELHSTIARQLFNDNKILSSRYDRILTGREPENEKELNVYWQKLFKEEDEELNVEFSTASEEEKEDERYVNLYDYPSKFTTMENTIIRQRDNQQQLDITYTKPLGEDAELETGYSGIFEQWDFDVYSEYYDTTTKKFLMDDKRTNLFLYRENNHAIFATYGKRYEKFSYKAGIRAEEVHIKGDLVTKDSTIKNSYFKAFPTLHLGYKLKRGELQLNYSKRINRPDGDELNPFPESTDPLNISAGNPKLLPEIIHSVEAGYRWQNDWLSFVPSIYYRYKVHGFTSVTIPLNDSVLLSTTQNLSSDQSLGLEIILSVKKNFFSINGSSNFFYNTIDASELGYENERSVVSMNTNLNAAFSFTKNTMLQLSSNYRSARLTPQGKQYPSFVFNSGLRQDLFNKKLSLTLTASDLFKTQRQKTIINTSFLQQTLTGRRDAPVFYLGINYRFGQSAKKNEEKLQFEEGL